MVSEKEEIDWSEECQNCRFWLKGGIFTYDRCRRWPKVWVVVNLYNDGEWSFPAVDADDTCGEWREKK